MDTVHTAIPFIAPDQAMRHLGRAGAPWLLDVRRRARFDALWQVWLLRVAGRPTGHRWEAATAMPGSGA